MHLQDPCPCHSKKKYVDCCYKLHEGGFAKTALELMRSRYSAYATGLAEYIIQTSSPEKQSDLKMRKEELLLFSKNTSFEDLEILDVQEGEQESYVTFFANLKQGDTDVSFTEKSRFEKIGDKWYYHSGDVTLGRE